MIFGTAEDVSGLPNSEAEDAISKYFMKVWAAFARDPENGLSGLGWPKYENSSGKHIRLLEEDFRADYE